MSFELREAGSEDVGTLLALMRQFNASQGYAFDEGLLRSAARELLGSPSLGRAWLIVAEAEVVGYVVLTFGFSFEYGGRDAFVDELFVEPRARGGGAGRGALAFVLDEASRLGVRAVHLEVERGNPAARALYEAAGFVAGDRQLLTHRVVGSTRKRSAHVIE